MRKYRSRGTGPSYAMQWDGTSFGATRIIDWIRSSGGSAVYQCSNPDRCAENNGDLMHTIVLNDGKIVGLRDWVVRDATGGFYPCKPDVFDKT